MNIQTPTEPVQAWLAKLSAEHAPVVAALRTLMASIAPDAHEIVYHDALGYGPTAAGFDRVLYVAAFRTHINLGFFYGGFLDDPEGRLIGTGKRMRHIKLTSPEECAHPAVARLLGQAWADARRRMAQRHGG